MMQEFVLMEVMLVEVVQIVNLFVLLKMFMLVLVFGHQFVLKLLILELLHIEINVNGKMM
jgi:hypothetical protein